jgi:integral membrane protein (TIGR01906 family)
MRRPVYNAKELTHLDDVAGITKLFQILLLVSAVAGLAVGLLLYARRELNVLLNACISGSAITITLTGCLVIWSLIDFNSLFYLFHIVSFSNELWLLDPSRDYLIMMFPQGFFFESAIWLVSSIIGLAILVLLACLALKKLLKPTDELGASV